MFGFGNRQKKDAVPSKVQDDYLFEDFNEEMSAAYDGTYEEGFQEFDYAQAQKEPVQDRTAYPQEDYYEKGPVTNGESFAPNPEVLNLKQELDRVTETVDQLNKQLEVKQSELNVIAGKVAEKDYEYGQKLKEKEFEVEDLKKALAEKEQEANQVDPELEREHAQLLEELSAAKERIATLEINASAQDGMKQELADLLIETKKQSSEMKERAEYEARLIRQQAEQEAKEKLHDASLELRVIKQEIKNYRTRLVRAQEETSQLFSGLLANSEKLHSES